MLVSYDEAQRMLGGVCRSTIKALAKDREIVPAYIGGRTLFRRDSILALIERRGTKARR